MKRLYVLIVLILGVIGLYGCETSNFEKPSNVQISGTTVTWDAVKDAESYIVIINNQEHTVSVTTFDLATLNLPSGSYSVTVVAKKGTTLSIPSTAVTFVVESSGLTLSAPIVTLTGQLLSWPAVTNATGYQVIINSTVHNTTATSFDLSTLNLTTGTYVITVKATAGTTLSQASAPKNYTVISAENREILYGALLKVVNPSYEADMERSDFENDEEFETYERLTVMIYLYLDVAIAEGMNGVDMANMLTFMVELPEKMSNPQPTAIKTELDKLGTYGLTPELFTSFMMTLGNEFLQISLEEQEVRRVELNATVADFQSDLNALMISNDFTTLMQSLRPYVESYDLGLFDQLDENITDIDVFRLYWQIENYINYIQYQYGYENEYGDVLTDEYVYLFQTLLWNVYYENPTLFNKLVTGTSLDVLYQIGILVSDYQYANDEIIEIEQQIEMMEIVLEMMDTESAELRILIEEVMTYLETLYDAIPMTLLQDLETLMASGDVSVEEILVFKDEIVDILIETLPEESSFLRVYETLFTLAASMTDTNVTVLVGHADTLAALDYNTILLGLEFLGSVDAKLVNDIIVTVDGMVSEPIYDPEQSYYSEHDIDFVKLVDLIMLILNHIDGFVDDQQALIDTIEAIDVEPMVLDFAGFAVGIAKTQLEQEVDTDTFIIISGLLDEFLVELPNYIDFYELTVEMDVKLIDHILFTQGQMLKDLALFIETEEPSPEVVLDFVELMIDHVMDYRGLIRSDLDLDFVTKLVGLLKLPMQGVCTQTGIDQDCDALYNALKPGLIDLFMQILLIEEAFITELDAVTGIYDQIETWNIETDLGLMAHVVISLDHIMDTDKALFESLMDIVFTDILGLDPVKAITNMDDTQLSEIESDITAKLNDIDADLDYLAALNFAALTESQIEELRVFFDTLFEVNSTNPIQ
ncbi:fibronectin type III domain-containing protein [Acholeplasma vituli]|uniref:Fibronectin type III domain-containing protein n=1 Tax=Paracholeplasma vituli TaxID=69473 RepID=A0ABT2PUK2_9MOLU|nr:fibronectin type III domain-containing protein [Paracholeplasma vituli]MCU0104621.1 fibronectin type III domain-containing protein [Paracholeplasma vituli]